jgi:hypothetical protein
MLRRNKSRGGGGNCQESTSGKLHGLSFFFFNALLDELRENDSENETTNGPLVSIGDIVCRQQQPEHHAKKFQKRHSSRIFVGSHF